MSKKDNEKERLRNWRSHGLGDQLPTPKLLGGYKTILYGQEIWVKRYDNFYTGEKENKADFSEQARNVISNRLIKTLLS